MAIKRDQSHLPAGSVAPAPSFPPDDDPWLLRELMTEVVTEFDRHYAPAIPELRFRFSNAAGCTRAIGYAACGIEESNPPDDPGRWVMAIGSILHDYLQRAMVRLYPHAEVEVVVDGRSIGLEGSGHGDIGLTEVAGRAQRIYVEIKTQGGFAFKLGATTFKGAPQGPKLSALRQGAIGAKAFDADELIVMYVSTEAVSKELAAGIGDDDPWRRVGAQWTYSRAEYEPIAQVEIDRTMKVLALVDAGEPIPRSVLLDDGTPVIVNNPVSKGGTKGAYTLRDSEGAIVAAGEHWMCGYCRWQDRCADEPEFVSPPEVRRG